MHYLYKIKMFQKYYLFVFILLTNYISTSQNVAPILSATGDQVYCPLTTLPIVTSMSITDPDDIGIDAIYIQISSGYTFGEDVLTLTGTNPNITSNWDVTQGKLTLTGISSQPTYISLVQAIENVQFSNSNPNPSGTRTISITVGQANYLPSNGHYYEYVPNLGITWTAARTAAANRTYYGLQGYLATITAADEAKLAGEQAPGAGWIGGSDEDSEGVWRWKTGPENGLLFWNGGINGSTPNFAFWNNGEPNNEGGSEDYVHITAPGVGIPGSWNDLRNEGEASGSYQPKGYIVEYGGMPNDPILQISTSTIINIPIITSTSSPSSCDPQSFVLEAIASDGIVNWYENATGGTPIATGTTFTTPLLNSTTTYFVDAYPIGCNHTRTAVTATINTRPIVSINPFSSICEGDSIILTASTTSGIIEWFTEETGGQAFHTGTSYTTPTLTETTTYYLEGNNNGCLSTNRLEVIIIVNTKPVVEDEEFVICENDILILDATTSNVATYLWSTGETTESITVSQGGVYEVILTTTENCIATKTFTIIANTAPVIETVFVNNSTATISYSGNGTFEFSIDGIDYQNSPIFTNLIGGEYTAYVNSIENCGIATLNFVVIGIPSFFTPNSDGFNDVLEVLGMSFYPEATLSIFNRYGQLIHQINQEKPTWDGTLNGNPVPSSDYWYVLQLNNFTPIQRGHFSLKR
jgi:gliding motility-associated-like protein